MPLVPLRIPPRVKPQFKPTLLDAGWGACQLVRFRYGLWQNVGGGAKVVHAAFIRICRGPHSWTQTDGLLDLGVGTHLKLWLY